mmetsp:Transcript_9790/g.30372  ORF Transcript_9790/g.30372 Transcript_9790/m.30372 type:complete len:202 (-) Transcript_9790:62-667(-)
MSMGSYVVLSSQQDASVVVVVVAVVAVAVVVLVPVLAPVLVLVLVLVAFSLQYRRPRPCHGTQTSPLFQRSLPPRSCAVTCSRLPRSSVWNVWLPSGFIRFSRVSSKKSMSPSTSKKSPPGCWWPVQRPSNSPPCNGTQTAPLPQCSSKPTSSASASGSRSLEAVKFAAPFGASLAVPPPSNVMVSLRMACAPSSGLSRSV